MQGVGFRPFIYRLAGRWGLRGWVNNSSLGVRVEVEGERHDLQEFLLSIEREKPPRSFIQGLEYSFLDPVGFASFVIRESDSQGEKVSIILPDIATCLDCLAEIFDPQDRRYLYPFTNCTNCGPRFSIIEAVPYDRPSTTMKTFDMCAECRTEYDDPLDRRFHAQPNACPACGPHLELWDAHGRVMASRHEALLLTAEAVRQGKIAAIKGIGGFQLVVDAGRDGAVERLRKLKRREEKPFALMFPSLAMAKDECRVSDLETRLLGSPESPVVLLRRKGHCPYDGSRIAASVAPGNPHLGIMLPYTPMHHLLMAELERPIVATSGNLRDEPICIDEREALERLSGIADVFLVHNRRIARHVDDSVARVVMGREMVVRRARGYAPLPVEVKGESLPVLAVGSHLKNTIAISLGGNVLISQHIGDLETSQALVAFRQVIDDLQGLYEHEPRVAACDAHPDYLSTRFAEKTGLPLVRVQHHYAHVLSCMAENELTDSVLGVAWDGTGFGLDGTVWGGEFLRVTAASFLREAHFRAFRLPGGEIAIREPRRAAVGLLYDLLGDGLLELDHLEFLASFSPSERRNLLAMLERKLNSPLTSSAGRLFDVVSALLGLRQENSFEGQAAMSLEFALEGIQTDESYPFGLSRDPVVSAQGVSADTDNPRAYGAGGSFDGHPPPAEKTLGSAGRPMNEGSPLVIDWGPAVRCILDDIQRGLAVGLISARFHNTLVETILAVARTVGEERVVLSGGCFQNRYLTERSVKLLEKEGFRPYWHQRVPPNDGGISLGQVMAANREVHKE